MHALDFPPGSGSICGARGEHWGEQGLNRAAKRRGVGLSPPPFCALLLAGRSENRFCGGDFWAGLMSATPAAGLAANKLTIIRLAAAACRRSLLMDGQLVTEHAASLCSGILWVTAMAVVLERVREDGQQISGRPERLTLAQLARPASASDRRLRSYRPL